MSRLSFVLAVALMSTAPIYAAARAETPPVRMSTQGVDFTDPAAVKAFYGRVRAAARTACSSNTLVPWASREDEACRRRFVKDAVGQVDQPLLTRLDDRASGRTSSVYVNDDR
jgi:UrcA family protein